MRIISEMNWWHSLRHFLCIHCGDIKLTRYHRTIARLTHNVYPTKEFNQMYYLQQINEYQLINSINSYIGMIYSTLCLVSVCLRKRGTHRNLNVNK